ncbi:hypothetical protein A0U40_03415 [[Bacillus] sp. KCTC 13219]|nr:hypothetical protein A0U40_03415 [[Bacillus] sp. KCTC 13219]
MTTPGIVLRSQYVMPNDKRFSRKEKKGFEDYIGYVNRADAKIAKLKKAEIQQQIDSFYSFGEYVNYVGDEKKQGALFIKETDFVNKKQRDELRKLFQLAQKNGSPLWQDVISFENSWLQQFNMMDEVTGQVNELKMKNVVREAVEKMLVGERMADSATWVASIHYNTDNIHVHVATVEPIPTRRKTQVFNKETKKEEIQYRGKRKQSSLDKMTSTVANSIISRKEQNAFISNLVRGARKAKKEQDFQFSHYRKTKKLFQLAIQKLPIDRSQWQYGYQSIDEARPYIDEMVDIFIERFYKDEMKELLTRLDIEAEILRITYGDGSRYQMSRQEKLDELRRSMGNAVLIELRNYAKENDRKTYTKLTGQPLKNRFERAASLNYALNNLNYRLRKTFHDYQKERNVEEFDRMLDGYER